MSNEEQSDVGGEEINWRVLVCWLDDSEDLGLSLILNNM